MTTPDVVGASDSETAADRRPARMFTRRLIDVRWSFIAGSILLGLMLIACSGGQVQRADGEDEIGYIDGDGLVTTIPPDERGPAPEFGGPLLGSANREFWLADAVGDIVVLNVWASWCPPCRKEAPDLQAVWEQVSDEGVQFIGVNTRDPSKVDALGFVEDFDITYPSIVDIDGRRMLAFRDTLPPIPIPSTLIFDREGRLAARALGAISDSTLSALIGDVETEDEV